MTVARVHAGASADVSALGNRQRTEPAADLPGAPRAMILAAGQATRLRPLTDDRAKAVLPFLNRPLLDFTLDWLSRAGFRDVVINLHHAGASVFREYRFRAFNMRVLYSCETRLLGTGGGPRRALELLGERTLLINGDVAARLNLGQILSTHRDSGALATLALHRGEASRGYPHVPTGENGAVLGFPGGESQGALPQGSSAGVFTGVHVLENEALAALPDNVPCGIVDPLYRDILADGLPIQGVYPSGHWYEIGEPSRYLDAQLTSLRREDLPLAFVGYHRRFEGGYTTGYTHIENSRVVPPFLLGPGVRVKHGAQLSGVVAGTQVRFENGCHVEQSIIWNHGWVGAGSRLERCIVMEGVEVPPETEAVETIFAPDGRRLSFAAPSVG